jgi:hypothetical protein
MNTDMLDDSRMKVFPPFVGDEDRCSPKGRSVQSFDARPSHELACHKAFDQVAVP